VRISRKEEEENEFAVYTDQTTGQTSLSICSLMAKTHILEKEN
jgi:hypothetical protein